MTKLEIYAKSAKTPIGVFADFFSTFKKEAFRLELLPEYDVEEEKEVFNEFLSGLEKPSKEFHSDWCKLVKEKTLSKAYFRRVRLISPPISDYIKFEVLWGYKKGIEAGEEIRIIKDKKCLAPHSSSIITKDFWLFDDTTCFFMEYDFKGSFLGVQKAPETIVPLMIEYKKNLIEQSMQLDVDKWASDFL